MTRNAATRQRGPGLLSGLLVAAALTVTPAFGQSAQPAQPRRPTGGMFRGVLGAPVQSGGPQLDFLAAAYGGHDDDLSALQGGGGQGVRRSAVGGKYGGLSGDLVFTNGSTRFPVTVQGTGDLRKYEQGGGITPAQNRLNVRIEPMLGRRWQLGLSQSVDASPFFDFGIGVARGEVQDVGTPADSRIARRTTMSLDSTAELRLQSTSRTQFAIRSGFRRTTVAEFPDFQSARAGFSWRRQATRYAGLRLGYEFEKTTGGQALVAPPPPSPGAPVTPSAAAAIGLHNIDAGLDYRRPLSFSRRTTVGAATGFAFSRQQVGRTFATATGIGTIEHQLGHSWSASANVRRGMRVLQALGGPTLENTVGAQVGGLITSRLDVLLFSDYAYGQFNPGGDTPDTSYTSLSTTVRLRLALTSIAAAYAEYGYYQSEFGSGLPFPTDFDDTVSRRSGRVGLTMVVPIVRQRAGRTARVTR